MRKKTAFTIVAVLTIFLVTNANAVKYYDNTSIWDNWTNPTKPAQDTQDVVGTGPEVNWMDIDIGPGGVLNWIKVNMSGEPRLFGGDRLFIDPDGGDLAWQYFGQTDSISLRTYLYPLRGPVSFSKGGLNAGLIPGDPPSKYTLSTGRDGHPDGIIWEWRGTGSLVDAFWNSSDSTWNYLFSDSGINIIMSSGWSIGFTEGCANDVIDVMQVTNGTPIPEPATMVLLGSGLIGLLGVHRRKMIWQKR